MVWDGEKKIEMQKIPDHPRTNCFGVNEAACGRKGDDSYMEWPPTPKPRLSAGGTRISPSSPSSPSDGNMNQGLRHVGRTPVVSSKSCQAPGSKVQQAGALAFERAKEAKSSQVRGSEFILERWEEDGTTALQEGQGAQGNLLVERRREKALNHHD